MKSPRQLPPNVKPVNLLQSGLPMRADLKTQELKWQKFWQTLNLWKQLRLQSPPRKFILHSGPPYANGDIHIGHALNIILKDFTLRFARAKGFMPVFVPGWDMHGLPIANAVLKTQNIKASAPNYRALCAQYAEQQMQNQTTQFQRLGLLIDWNQKYWTSQNMYVANQLRVLAKMATQKLLFYALKPVFWSWSSQTALAETEIEYKSYTSQAVFVAFPCQAQNFLGTSFAFLVWTTTPWTLVANQFLAINKTFNYVLFRLQNRNWIVEKTAFMRLKKLYAWKTRILRTFLGTKLLNLVYQHCYLPFQSRVLHADFVTKTTGTGIVHLAPAFGVDDFHVVQDLKTQIVVPLDEKGHFNADVADPTLATLFYQTAQPLIIAKIAANNNLFHQAPFVHQYPHDWRTHQPVIYRATRQLFVNLTPLQSKFQPQLNAIKWIPSWGKIRLLKLLQTRKTWCLSRQRRWGVPLPLLFTANQTPLLVPELITHIADLVAKHGDQIWWDWPVERLFPAVLIKKYGIKTKSSDTVDVWFDSGCSLVNLYPHTQVDLIWEGNDQFRGWFNSLMIVAALFPTQINLQQIATHGFVNDETGLKMSKSRGNVIQPLTICQQDGADLLRLWVASTNYYDDVTIGTTKLTQVRQNYLKLRLTMRFLLDNLTDFVPSLDQQTLLSPLDDWILFHAKIVFTELQIAFTKRAFHHAFALLLDFCTTKVSAIYFNFIKPTLYLSSPTHQLRRQHQTTLWLLYQHLLAVYALFIPHTAEEIFQVNRKLIPVSVPSVHLCRFPQPLKWPKSLTISSARLTFALKWHYRFYVRGLVTKAIENLKSTQVLPNTRYAEVVYTHQTNFQLFSSEGEKGKFLATWKIKTSSSYEVLNQRFQVTKGYDFTLWKPFLQVASFTFRLADPEAQTPQLKITCAQGTKCSRCHEIKRDVVKNYCQNCRN